MRGTTLPGGLWWRGDDEGWPGGGGPSLEELRAKMAPGQLEESRRSEAASIARDAARRTGALAVIAAYPEAVLATREDRRRVLRPCEDSYACGGGSSPHAHPVEVRSVVSPYLDLGCTPEDRPRIVRGGLLVPRLGVVLAWERVSGE